MGLEETGMISLVSILLNTLYYFIYSELTMTTTGLDNSYQNITIDIKEAGIIMVNLHIMLNVI